MAKLEEPLKQEHLVLLLFYEELDVLVVITLYRHVFVVKALDFK